MTASEGRPHPGPALRRTGAEIRRATSDRVDAWLGGLADPLPPGSALLAVGALGRRELVAGSDLDLIVIHRAGDREAIRCAESIWYSVWDSPWALDHSVRTVDEALAVAGVDLRVAAGFLDLRHLAGDASVADDLRMRTLAAWVRGGRRRLPEVLAAAAERERRAGEVAFLLEPDLKESRGGLRDGLIPRQVAAAQVADLPPAPIEAARELLLDVRGALHDRASEANRKPGDRLLLQDQDGVAADLGYGDADGLMADVAAAARLISQAVDLAGRRVAVWSRPVRSGWLRGGRHWDGKDLDGTRGDGKGADGGRRGGYERVPVAPGVLRAGGEIVLAADVVASADDTLAMRAARAAAETGLPLAERTLERLASCPRPAEATRWTPDQRNAFVALLGAGPAAVAVIETLDAAGIWQGWLPDWPRLRSRPQRNAFHRFTVDRHLLEAAAEAAAFTREVARPDLLLVGALLHDLGKGWPGEDHTVVGLREVPPLAVRMGFTGADVEVLTALVRCHIMLAELATTRDTTDPATAATLAANIGSREALELLRWLSEADSRATGPAMWSTWKAGLIDDLVRRTGAVLAGAQAQPEPALTPAQQSLIELGTLAVEVGDGRVTVAAPRHEGLLATVVGVLSLARLDIRSVNASVHPAGHGETGLIVSSVAPRFGGGMPDAVLIREELAKARNGQLDLAAELASRAAAYPVPSRALLAPPRVLWDDRPTGDNCVVELRAPDGPGLLGRVTAALAACGLLVHAARCTTLGAEALDAFYVSERDGSPTIDPQRRRDIGDALLGVAMG